jgi:hypothetical protein
MVRLSRNSEKDPAMKTFYDDVAIALVSVSFCIVCVSMVVAVCSGVV